MKRKQRVRRRSEFEAAIKGKRFYSGRSFVGFAVHREATAHRVGVTVSRAIKSAVARNRARRRLREAARSSLFAADSPLARRGIRYDVILIARPATLEVSFAELKAEAEHAALRLSEMHP